MGTLTIRVLPCQQALVVCYEIVLNIVDEIWQEWSIIVSIIHIVGIIPTICLVPLMAPLLLLVFYI